MVRCLPTIHKALSLMLNTIETGQSDAHLRQEDRKFKGMLDYIA